MSGTVASGLFRRLSIGRQSAKGSRAGAGTGKMLGRVQMAPNFNIDSFGSSAILPSQMERTARNGVGRGVIPYQGELAPGNQTDFLEGIMRRQFAAVPGAGALTNVTAAAGPPGTFTRATGSWITDGYRVGMVVRPSGWTTTGAANNGRNYRIIALTALVMTVTGTGNEVVAAKASGDSVTFPVVGKVTYMPPSGQVIPYYTVEDWQPDLAVPSGIVFEDCRVQQVGINLPATGMAQFSAQMAARDALDITAVHFTSPTAPPNNPALAGVSGLLRYNGADVAIITSFGMQIAAQMQADPTVGANRVPDIIMGPVTIRGQFSAYVTDRSFFAANRNETEAELLVYLTTSPAVNADFMAFTMPRVKLQTPQMGDSPMAMMQQVTFVALENTVTTGGYEATNLMIQDSTI